MLLGLLILPVLGYLSLALPGDEAIGPGEDSNLISNYWIFSVMIDNLAIWQLDNFGAEDIWGAAIAIL